MEKKVVGPKELGEALDAIVGLVKAVKKALADGFQPADITAIVGSEFGELMTGITGIELVAGEIKADLFGSLSFAGLAAGELIGVLLEPKPAPGVVS